MANSLLYTESQFTPLATIGCISFQKYFDALFLTFEVTQHITAFMSMCSPIVDRPPVSCGPGGAPGHFLACLYFQSVSSLCLPITVNGANKPSAKVT